MPQPLAGLSVILVEDDLDSREVLEIALTAESAAVRMAASAEAALALFKSAPPTIVLTDITLPDQDGMWLLQQIRALPGSSVPIIAFTGRAFPHETEAIMAAGFDAVIVKPADVDNIVAVIVRVVSAAGEGAGRGEERSVPAFDYSRAPMSQGRMDKTVDKMRRGGLPVPTEHTRVPALGDGRPCEGCGETVNPTEAQSTIRLLGLDWRLHEECYAAWSTFTG